MLPVAKAKHLDVIHFYRSSRRRDVPRGAMENTVVRPSECAFLDGDGVDDVNDLDFDMRIRECSEPAAEERSAGGLSLALDAPWGFEDDIVGKDFRKTVNVVGVEGCSPFFESFARGHWHWILLRIAKCAPRIAPGTRRSLG